MKNPNMKREWSLETREKLSNAMKGTTNHLYIDGRSSNPEWRSWIRNKRNRDKRMIDIGHSFNDWEIIKEKYKTTCPCCLRKEPEIILTQDHIIPLSKGGDDSVENIQPLCRSCNSSKHTITTKYPLP